MQKTGNLFLDINILLDIPDNERENHFFGVEILSLADKGLLQHTVQFYHSIFSFMWPVKKLGQQLALDYISTFLEIIKVLPADINIVMQSLLQPISEFEDSMQYYSALQIKNIDYIVTSNTKDFKKSKIPVVTPLQYLKIYQSQ